MGSMAPTRRQSARRGDNLLARAQHSKARAHVCAKVVCSCLSRACGRPPARRVSSIAAAGWWWQNTTPNLVRFFGRLWRPADMNFWDTAVELVVTFSSIMRRYRAKTHCCRVAARHRRCARRSVPPRQEAPQAALCARARRRAPRVRDRRRAAAVHSVAAAGHTHSAVPPYNCRS